MKVITTSWDDGCMTDFKLADLLSKYNLKGTFYIPRTNPERKVMNPERIVSLSKQHEIGGHTLDHVRLDISNKHVIDQQVKGSYLWLKELLETEPVSFCFPKGKFNSSSINAVFDAGYKVARTSELLSLNNANKTLLPTTLQVYEHSTFTLIRHLILRSRWLNLIKWLKTFSLNNLLLLSETYVGHVVKHGGCFHLSGHSWEIEEYNLWQKLEEIFKMISNISEIRYLQNKDLIAVD